MIKPITFCIPTAKNEKEYIRLLIQSLIDNTQIELHEILVFIDTDNQGSYEMLKDFKKQLSNLKIYRNTRPCQVGGQRNISIMFNKAKNDIVCYLQSDMVVGKDIDKHISECMTSEDVVLSCTRIEPPLHPESPEKLVRDFGLSPEGFDVKAFNDCVESLQKENRPLTRHHFAPFSVYKKTWLNVLGGFDTQFRCSREDSDMNIRMNLAKLNLLQSWKACVYHFTCVSSRGQDWYKSTEDAKYKNELQSLADQQELKRFIRKWGFFGHQRRPMYEIAFEVEIDRYVNFNFLKHIEPYCSKLYISDKSVVDQLINQLEFDSHYYTNLRWNYPTEYWEKVKHLFNPMDFRTRVLSGRSQSEGVVVSFKYSEITNQLTPEVMSIIENIHGIVHSNEKGKFVYGPLTIDIKNPKINQDDNILISNRDLLLNDESFDFI
jgi:glycosyltransferase involved in cell wall biosynthesis